MHNIKVVSAGPCEAARETGGHIDSRAGNCSTGSTRCRGTIGSNERIDARRHTPSMQRGNLWAAFGGGIRL